jgi:UDP-N-acetylmuramoyl-L-alanyl-D-glutamate--2,6-diaminopimelate ligase
MTKKMIFINEDCKNSRKIIKTVSSEAKVNYYNTGYNADGHKTKLFNNTATKYNLSMIYSLLKQSKMQDKDIISVFEKLKPIKGRLNIFSKKKFSKFIIDYAHTPDSIRSLLKDIHAIYSKNMNKIIIVFGCGGDRDKSKRLQMGKIADKYCDVIILTDDNPRKENSQKIIDDISKGITYKNKLFIIPKRKDAIKKSIKVSQKNDIVMILGKGNEDVINYGDTSIEHNDIKYLSYLLNEN